MRTFILRHDDPKSHEYANTASESCDKFNMKWEYFEGFSKIKGSDALKSLGIDVIKETQADIHSSKNKAQLCTASHVAIWKKMIDEKIHQAIILEHDAIMIQPFDMILPKQNIIALGYKTTDIDRYKPPEEKTCCLTRIDKIHGSHAYALTLDTAKSLYDGVYKRRTAGCIDSHIMQTPKFRNSVGMMIADPIVALGWLRDSTIWNQSSSNIGKTIKSYRENLS